MHKINFIATQTQKIHMISTTQYKGGFVLQPKAGIYKNIIVLDFRSLYPSIIVTHNIDTSTLQEKQPISSSSKVPGFNRWFLKSPIGKIPKRIKKMIHDRTELKKLIRKTKNKKKLTKLRKKELSLKLATNIQYGLFAYPKAENYNIKVAESISAFGRYYITETIKKARSSGFKIIYSDTDSIFIQGKNPKAFLLKLNKWLPGIIKLEFRGKYKRALFTDVKKRYALLGKKVEIRGFEAVRGDWCPLAKETQQKVIELVLKKKNKQAIKYVKNVINNINKYQLPKFIISKQLSRPLSEYKVKSAHIEVAKKLKASGKKIKPGSVVDFIITKTKGKHSDKAIHTSKAKKSNIDYNYYTKKQILPVSLRILKVFNIKEKDLL